MSNLYYEFLKSKVECAKDCEYLIKRKLYPDMEEDVEIEKRSGDKQDDYMSDISKGLYAFKENFFKFIGKNLFQNKIEDYKVEAIKYLESSFPFCFNIDIHNMEENKSLCGIDTLVFYAMTLGADSEKIKNVINMLTHEKLKRVNGEINRKDAEFTDTQMINIDNIEGSSIEGYTCNNMYEALCLLDDKNISRYIEYVAKSGALGGNNKVFTGIAIDQDIDGNLLVSEGNHRVFAYKLIKLIKEYVTNQKINGIQINPSICKLKYRAIIDDNEVVDKSNNGEIEF